MASDRIPILIKFPPAVLAIVDAFAAKSGIPRAQALYDIVEDWNGGAPADASPAPKGKIPPKVKGVAIVRARELTSGVVTPGALPVGFRRWKPGEHTIDKVSRRRKTLV